MANTARRNKAIIWAHIQTALLDYPSDAIVRVIEQNKEPHLGERIVRRGAGLAITVGATGMSVDELLLALSREGAAIQSDAEAIIPPRTRTPYGTSVSSTERTLPIVDVSLESDAETQFVHLRLRDNALLSSVFPAARYPKG